MWTTYTIKLRRKLFGMNQERVDARWARRHEWGGKRVAALIIKVCASVKIGVYMCVLVYVYVCVHARVWVVYVYVYLRRACMHAYMRVEVCVFETRTYALLRVYVYM
jgi:hypothetical protein